MRSLLKDDHGVIDITIAITVGIVFAALMVISYIIWTMRSMLIRPGAGVTPTQLNNSINNITGGFDQTIKIIIIAILVAVLAIALSYLMMLRQG
jgi:hypothetical protein